MTLIQHIGDNPARPYVEGDTLRLAVDIEDDDGQAVDLTAWGLSSARYWLSQQTAGGGFVPVAQTALGSGINHSGGNELLITIPAGATSGHRGVLRHELELQSGAGMVKTVFIGRVKITPESIPNL